MCVPRGGDLAGEDVSRQLRCVRVSGGHSWREGISPADLSAPDGVEHCLFPRGNFLVEFGFVFSFSLRDE